MLDVVIRGGQVVDGTGRAPFAADIGIAGGAITAVGEVTDDAARTIDATGSVVCPGFVDLHTHFDAQVFWDPALTPTSLHGVTTVIAGNCGFSIAPIVEREHDYILRMLARVEGMPIEALQANVPWNWSTTGEFLASVDGTTALNIGFLVGHSALRRVVMGERASEGPATAEEIDQMVAILRESLAAGGLGFSSSRGGAHYDDIGRPVPSRFAADEELIALAGACRDFPGTSLAFIPPATTADVMTDAEMELMATMSVAAQRRLNWNVLGVQGVAGLERAQQRLRAGDVARQAGGQVVALAMPTSGETHFNFFSGMSFDAIAGWAPFMQQPVDVRLKALKEPSERARLTQLLEDAGQFGRFFGDWANRKIVHTEAPENKQYEGRMVGEIAAEQGKTPFDALLDIVCADGLRTSFSSVKMDESDDDWDARRQVLQDDRVIVGGSDAGAHLDMIAGFNYPTALLAAVRDRGVLSLEEAIRLLTDAPASFYGLTDRGRLAEGARADIVVFDPESVGSGPIETRHDIPGTEIGRLFAQSIGIQHVLVNGVEVVTDGALTPARPGTVLRSGIDTHTTPLDT